MANIDDNAVVRVERNGVEYFTIKETGESGMSQTGLARACGKSRQALIKLESALVTKAPSKWLKPFVGKDLTLVTNCVKNGGLVLVYSSGFCSATIKHYAYSGSEKAQDFDSALGIIGLTSYIQSQTGWLPTQYIAAPQAHQAISRVMDFPDPWVKMYDVEFCRQVYAWKGSQFFWIFCYHWLTPIERCELDSKNPVVNGRRKIRIHQYFSQDIKDRLRENIGRLVAIVDTANGDYQAFVVGFQKHFEGIDQSKLF